MRVLNGIIFLFLRACFLPLLNIPICVCVCVLVSPGGFSSIYFQISYLSLTHSLSPLYTHSPSHSISFTHTLFLLLSILYQRAWVTPFKYSNLSENISPAGFISFQINKLYKYTNMKVFGICLTTQIYIHIYMISNYINEMLPIWKIVHLFVE